MARKNLTKPQAAAMLQIAGIPRKSFSIPEFCARHGIGLTLYRTLRKEGKGPKEKHVGDRVIITQEAETEWERLDVVETETT